MRTLMLLAALAALSACGPKAEPPAPAPAPLAPEHTVIDVPSFALSSAPADLTRGEELFGQKGCTACHKIGGGKLVGPDLKGVTARRDLDWIKKMILRPDVMVKEDDAAKKLLADYFTPMPNQGVNPDTELPALVSFLKSKE